MLRNFIRVPSSAYRNSILMLFALLLTLKIDGTLDRLVEEARQSIKPAADLK